MTVKIELIVNSPTTHQIAKASVVEFPGWEWKITRRHMGDEESHINAHAQHFRVEMWEMEESKIRFHVRKNAISNSSSLGAYLSDMPLDFLSDMVMRLHEVRHGKK